MVLDGGNDIFVIAYKFSSFWGALTCLEYLELMNRGVTIADPGLTLSDCGISSWPSPAGCCSNAAVDHRLPPRGKHWEDLERLASKSTGPWFEHPLKPCLKHRVQKSDPPLTSTYSHVMIYRSHMSSGGLKPYAKVGTIASIKRQDPISDVKNFSHSSLDFNTCSLDSQIMSDLCQIQVCTCTFHPGFTW